MKHRKFKVSFTYNLHTHHEVQELWAPLPLTSDYQSVLGFQQKTNCKDLRQLQEPVFLTNYLYAKWPPTTDTAFLSFNFIVDLKERTGGDGRFISAEEQALYLQARPHVPVDGIVADIAQNITRGINEPLKKAKAIYEWLCAHAERNANQVGCGLGNVKEALLDQHICGRCVDISSVFVALMRAAGIPAREVFGVRLGPSTHAQKLGRTGIVSESQHCRCEFYIEDQGWVPCDPGDVTKVALDEGLGLTDARYLEIREKLFAYWEPNWLAYNTGRDFQLSPGTGTLENYLMYPIALNLEERKSAYVPQEFAYEITSEELNSQ